MMKVSMFISNRMTKYRVGVSAGVVDDISNIAMMCKSQFKVIYNPIPSKKSASIQSINKAEKLWKNEKKRVVSVGSFKAQKNHKLLLQSLLKCNRDTQLMFVGDGDGRDELEQLAIDLGVADRVLFAGFQPDRTPFYETADLFVLSSNYEGFGNVIVEALAAGTPVVSTDCPSGPAEILENGKYGKLVPVGDVDAMASAIDEALNEEVDKEFLKKRAAYFSPERAADAYLSLLGLQ